MHRDRVSGGGIELDVTRMSLPLNLQDRYGALLSRAVQNIEKLEQGAYANIHEGRQVGHNWLRNPALAPEQYCEDLQKSRHSIDAFRQQFADGGFKSIAWIGIGGSAMAPQLLHDALRTPGVGPAMFFFDNTDPAGFQRTLREIELSGGLESTLVVVVSKSGGTKETRNGMRVVKEEFERKQLKFEKNAVAITKCGSDLDQFAADWLARFPLWDWVGGRTSMFSAVGMLPAALCDLGMQELIDGARRMDDDTRGESLEENPALLLAASWYYAVEVSGLRNMVLLPYCDQLQLLSKYLQQLVMESLGKDGKGISVFGNKGSTDQHSFVQQLREGYADFFATFICIRDPGPDPVVDTKCDANYEDWTRARTEITAGDYLAAFQEGTAQALYDAGRPSLRLTVKELNAEALGAIIALFERAVGFYAEMIGVNAYHQPGVEAGKAAAERVLDAQSALVHHLQKTAGQPVTVAELVKATKVDGDLAFDTLHRLHVCRNRCGVTLLDSPDDTPISDCRFMVVQPS